MHPSHEHYWELIPWTVNGRASEAQQQAVLAHAEECGECRNELARHQELQRHMRGSDDVIAAPNASWQKLLAEIDQQPAQQPAQQIQVRPSRRQPWLIAALWIQLVAIAALAGALFRSMDAPDPAYSTLASVESVPERSDLRVVFAPGAPLDEINRLLRTLECEIVAGPSEAGVYTLALRDPSEVQRVMLALRERSEVLFAERGQSAADGLRR